jgi:hypothetical protein
MRRSRVPLQRAFFSAVTTLVAIPVPALAAEPVKPALLWQAGAFFEYASSGETATSSGPATLPKPIRQTVRVVGQEECPSGTCWRLEADQTLAPLSLPGAAPAQAENTSSSRALVDTATGNLIQIERTIQLMGQEHVSTTEVKSRNALFAEFYGPWMLDLADDYQEVYELQQGVRTYEVTGRETVDGRECFVVVRITPAPSGDFTKTTFWVDVRERVAVRVREGPWGLDLVSKASRP